MVRTRQVTPVLVAAALALAGAGCGKTTDTPWSTPGFAPLEPADPAAWPTALPGDPHPPTLGAIPRGKGSGYNWAKGRGYVHAPLAKVYQALHDPEASRIRTSVNSWPVTATNVEDYPISYEITYSDSTLGFKVSWIDRYRGGVSQYAQDGTTPVVVGLRYHRVHGDSHIPLQDGSIVAYAVDGDPNVTAVEIVCWLNASTTDENTVAGTVGDWFNGLSGVVAALPP
jgi:hypothetical protein